MITYFTLSEFNSHEKELRDFIRNNPFGRYLSDRSIAIENSGEFELENLRKYAENSNIILALNSDGIILGFIGFHFSSWDSDVFLKRVAILKYFSVKEFDIETEIEIANHFVNMFHRWTKENRINVVITKLDTQYFVPILTLQKNGYILYECITFRSLNITDEVKSIGEGINYRYAIESDKETLKLISLKNTFRKSHFYLDPNFDKGRVDYMYSRWIENAIESNQKIVIIEEDNQIAGVFIYDLIVHSLMINIKFGVWKSAFVDSSFRYKGIGLKLFKSTLQSCINDGVDIVDSSLVEKNLISQSFHDKLGFRLVNTLYTLHKWFD